MTSVLWQVLPIVHTLLEDMDESGGSQQCQAQVDMVPGSAACQHYTL